MKENRLMQVDDELHIVMTVEPSERRFMANVTN
jgi:hypothetical protein